MLERICKLVQPLWRTEWRILKKLKNRTTIWSSNLTPWECIHTPMFTAALFRIARTWKQPKCPLTDDLIKIWYIYVMEYYLTIKNNAIRSNMDEPRDDHTKWSKSDRERQISCDITYMWNLKNYTNELVYKTEIDSQT